MAQDPTRYRQFLDCPFCGQDDLQMIFLLEVETMMSVRCRTCGATGPVSITLHGAVQWWNTREGEQWDSSRH